MMHFIRHQFNLKYLIVEQVNWFDDYLIGDVAIARNQRY